MAEFLPDAQEGDVVVAMNHDTFCGIISGTRSYSESIIAHDIEMTGDIKLAARLDDIIDF